MRHKLLEYVVKQWARLVLCCHITYLSTAFLEGHGYYSIAAALLAVVLVVGSYFHLEGE